MACPPGRDPTQKRDTANAVPCLFDVPDVCSAFEATVIPIAYWVIEAP